MNVRPKLIRVLNVDLLSVLEGRKLTFETDDGQEVEIRLMTADEYEAYLRDRAAQDPDAPPIPPRRSIEALTTAIPTERLL